MALERDGRGEFKLTNTAGKSTGSKSAKQQLSDKLVGLTEVRTSHRRVWSISASPRSFGSDPVILNTVSIIYAVRAIRRRLKQLRRFTAFGHRRRKREHDNIRRFSAT